MPSAIVAIAGAVDANSYLTVQQASDILDDRLGSGAWSTADPDDQVRALLQATADIDANRFQSRPVSSTQALAFPRCSQDESFDQVPLAVRRACAEQALALLQNDSTGGRTNRQQLQAQGVTSIRVGDASETYSGSSSSTARNDLHPQARKHLQHWISRTGQILGPYDVARDDNQSAWWPFTP